MKSSKSSKTHYQKQVKPRILFLDIDGVISSCRNLILQKEYDHTAVALLKDLQDKCGFLIVMSSSRRKHFKDAQVFLDELKEETGLTVIMHEDWRTTSHPIDPLSKLPKQHQLIFKSYRKKWKKYLKTYHDTRFWRGHEIWDWLLSHGNDFNYVVVDDSLDLFPIPLERVVHIKGGEHISGMLLEHYDQIAELFGEPT